MTCELLDELRAIGVEVIPQGENLAIRPASKVPPELKERLRAHKAEVLAVLKARPATCAASCYEIEPGRWIHHPWDGCKTDPQAPAAKAVERECWHCRGKGKCSCVACDSGPCLPCGGTGRRFEWIH
jgi:TubC N-terminal docking domain